MLDLRIYLIVQNRSDMLSRGCHENSVSLLPLDVFRFYYDLGRERWEWDTM